jgi:hypothetical protein
MAKEAREYQRSGALTTSGGSRVAERVFRVNETDTSAPIFSAEEAMSATYVDPRVGGDAIFLPVVTDIHPDYPDLFASTFRTRLVPDSGGRTCWEIVWTYETLGGGGPPPDPTIPTFNLSMQSQWIDAWREQTTTVLIWDRLTYFSQSYSQPQFLTDAIERDIAGQPIDSGGIPTSTELRFGSIDVRFVTDATYPFTRIFSLVNTRNVTSVFGTELRGSLLFKGAEVANIGVDAFEVVLHWVWDPIYHHARQRVWMNPDDQTEYTGKKVGQGPATDYYEHGFPVFWVQPYPVQKDHNVLGDFSQVLP